VALVHADGTVLKLPFKAKLGATWRFYPEALPNNADFSGRWTLRSRTATVVGRPRRQCSISASTR
jgi:hypothetical protein